MGLQIKKCRVAAVHSGVGLTEVNGFNRIEITGAGAHDWLDRMFCLLNHHGNVTGGATLAYEVHVPNASVYAARLALRAAGEAALSSGNWPHP